MVSLLSDGQQHWFQIFEFTDHSVYSTHLTNLTFCIFHANLPQKKWKWNSLSSFTRFYWWILENYNNLIVAQFITETKICILINLVF